MAQSPWCESYRIKMSNHLIPLDQPTCTFFVVVVSQWINQFCKTNLAIFFYSHRFKKWSKSKLWKADTVL